MPKKLSTFYFKLLNSSSPSPSLTLKFGNDVVERVSSIHFLGITYQEHLSWKLQMQKILGKVKSQLWHCKKSSIPS